MSTTNKSVPVVEHSSSTTRRCIEPECGTPLSLYNTGDKCWHHQSKLRRAVIGMSAGRNPLPVWVPPRVVLKEQVAAVPELLEPVAPQFDEGYIAPGEKILISVCAFFQAKRENILGPGQKRFEVHPRQVLMYLLKNDTTLSLPRIGAMFNKDHSTVLHAVRKIAHALKTDVLLQKQIASIRSYYQQAPE